VPILVAQATRLNICLAIDEPRIRAGAVSVIPSLL